jgi:3'(2'), 5'-bisphosphate nucleotidase
MNPILLNAIKACLNAGKEILEVYHEDDFEIKIKSDDSPLTIADQKAHEEITQELSKTNIHILSEEGKSISFDERSKWEMFWLVDPLDGTKEFIKRNGEFTVNIALIKGGDPIMGVIYVPVTKDLYFSEQSLGAFKAINIDADSDSLDFDALENTSFKLPFISDNEIYTVVGSRSHMSKETEEFIENLRKQHEEIDIISKGSSLKICMVAEGIANVYPRFAPTMEWDTAAGHAIALGAGCTVTQSDEQTPVIYNKKDLLNPWFIIKR